MAVTLCDPNSEEVVDYEFFWIPDANGTAKKWFVFDYMRVMGQSRVSCSFYLIFIEQNKSLFIAVLLDHG